MDKSGDHHANRCLLQGNIVIHGSRTIPKSLPVIIEKLKTILAGANCEVVDASDDRLSFRHGTYLTQTASLIPKTGTIALHGHGESTNVVYSVETSGPAKWWLIFVAIIFCWAVFPPILIYRALVIHPRRFMENIIAGV